MAGNITCVAVTLLVLRSITRTLAQRIKHKTARAGGWHGVTRTFVSLYQTEHARLPSFAGMNMVATTTSVLGIKIVAAQDVDGTAGAWMRMDGSSIPEEEEEVGGMKWRYPVLAVFPPCSDGDISLSVLLKTWKFCFANVVNCQATNVDPFDVRVLPCW